MGDIIFFCGTGYFIGANVGVKFLVAFANGNSAYAVGLGFGVEFRAGGAFRKGFYLFGELGIGEVEVAYRNYY